MESEEKSARSQQVINLLFDEWQGYSQQLASGIISSPKEQEMILSVLIRAYNLGYQDGWVKSHTRTSDAVSGY